MQFQFLEKEPHRWWFSAQLMSLRNVWSNLTNRLMQVYSLLTFFQLSVFVILPHVLKHGLLFVYPGME